MLCTSLDYFKILRKNLFAIIKQISPPTCFVTFTSIKRLWDPLIKALHTLHVKKLNLLDKIEDLQSIHIIELIHNDPITCARYYDHKTSCFCTLFNKDPSIFEQMCDNFFVTKFQKCDSEHDHGLLWIKDASTYGIIQMKKLKILLINAMYHYCQLHYKMHNNINTLKHVKK